MSSRPKRKGLAVFRCRSFRVPHSEFRFGSSLKPAVEAAGGIPRGRDRLQDGVGGDPSVQAEGLRQNSPGQRPGPAGGKRL
jgi:hypothetical protein